MKIRKLLFVLVGILVFTAPTLAKVSSMQLLFLIKQAFPDVQEINVFINSTEMQDELATLTRAATQMQIKANVYEIANAANIGTGIQQIANNSILLVYDDEIFNNTKNKLYILSKCKEKQIAIVSSSNDFIQSGALLGYVDTDGSKKIVLNLTYYDHLKSKFTPDVIQQIGVNQVIPADYLSLN